MITYDLEADGLYEEATKIHCIVLKDDYTVYRLYDLWDIYVKKDVGDLELNRANLIDIFMSSTGPVICHNQFGYDIWMLRKFFNIDLVELIGYPRLVDTFVWSQAMYPDRELPRGCPSSISLPGNRIKRIGPHGLDSYGYRTGVCKPSISDWDTFDDKMLNRCVQDVLINEKTYYYLLKERDIL